MHLPSNPSAARSAARWRRWPSVTGATALLFTALAVLLAAHDWAPFAFERAADDWSAAHRPGAARAVAVAITTLGSAVVPYLLALAAGAVVLRAIPAPRPPSRAVALLLAPLLWLIAGQLVRLGLMHLFARPRPPLATWATGATGASGYSFPSGHSFTAAVCAGLLALAIARTHPSAARAAAAGAALFAALVGLSRVYLGVHWPLDVLGGWLLAAAWLAAGTAVLRAAVLRAVRDPAHGR
ncbi:phosphatase PAP2 family protein [Streptomyces sp. FH025]|uniref:phosphatase PAP2 family protein n=1 Tax=Streptomyces sp. FH025 TaxID=2815937 RepID=UPI001A9F9729|nr:phosphatase PAP2 family protein [Streptomyces sp. FH025]MBO1414226.1 phosphatase PAP2 family protein [Streptomyces sp. FH025]